MLGISKNTVKGIIRAQVSRSQMGAVATSALPCEVPPCSSDWRLMIAWDEVLREYSKRYTTIKCLHGEYGSGVSYL